MPEVVVIPKEPNYFGSFSVPNHSGPAQYLQGMEQVLRAQDCALRDVAAFLVDYSIQDDLRKEALSEGNEDRGAERVLSASFARSQLRHHGVRVRIEASSRDRGRLKWLD